ncbi:TraR/DksA family transcriptional regulator [Nocardioides sp. MAH-18]|uniref:TraR/DksA family transcriptional regulator n=1 Tax=Nocardioides agri TaxID=2682843 RepID=A0A6L6XWB8_9ACTN|nr:MULTISPECIES: TraR/DksA C4-type zinc finger protein [unclassified Nocardioides]MBA2955916.1 TraR/DksA C4-type zinc finger protein [Nocardioides sp. CGMCC 1.13656]MVQ50766.1 TraR/DksA family transcriptional regulator [Nocardioides sp. MAH-18]
MTDARELLADERRRTLRRLADLRGDYQGFVEASNDSNADDEHDPEGATIAFERSQVGALVQQAEEHLRAIDAAQARLDEGRYGVCVVCGKPIPAERLEVRPTAATCVACAQSRSRPV